MASITASLFGKINTLKNDLTLVLPYYTVHGKYCVINLRAESCSLFLEAFYQRNNNRHHPNKTIRTVLSGRGSLDTTGGEGDRILGQSIETSLLEHPLVNSGWTSEVLFYTVLDILSQVRHYITLETCLLMTFHLIIAET